VDKIQKRVITSKYAIGDKCRQQPSYLSFPISACLSPHTIRMTLQA